MYGKTEGFYFIGGKVMIKFLCWEPSETVVVNDRREAIKMIQQGKFRSYKNVVVCLSNDERFNLESARAKEYFGIKR